VIQEGWFYARRLIAILRQLSAHQGHLMRFAQDESVKSADPFANSPRNKGICCASLSNH
jgi:hypothetical protein